MWFCFGVEVILYDSLVWSYDWYVYILSSVLKWLVHVFELTKVSRILFIEVMNL